MTVMCTALVLSTSLFQLCFSFFNLSSSFPFSLKSLYYCNLFSVQNLLAESLGLKFSALLWLSMLCWNAACSHVGLGKNRISLGSVYSLVFYSLIYWFYTITTNQNHLQFRWFLFCLVKLWFDSDTWILVSLRLLFNPTNRFWFGFSRWIPVRSGFISLLHVKAYSLAWVYEFFSDSNLLR